MQPGISAAVDVYKNSTRVLKKGNVLICNVNFSLPCFKVHMDWYTQFGLVKIGNRFFLSKQFYSFCIKSYFSKHQIEFNYINLKLNPCTAANLSF